MKNLRVKVGLFLAYFGLAGCGPSLIEEEVAQAKSLIFSNILCETMVKYRVGALSLLAVDGVYHKELGSRMAGAIDYDFSEMRQKADVAFAGDLQDILDNFPRNEYEYYISKAFYAVQDSLKEKYGYSYPDCDIILSMSEAFIKHKGI